MSYSTCQFHIPSPISNLPSSPYLSPHPQTPGSCYSNTRPQTPIPTSAPTPSTTWAFPQAHSSTPIASAQQHGALCCEDLRLQASRPLVTLFDTCCVLFCRQAKGGELKKECCSVQRKGIVATQFQVLKMGRERIKGESKSELVSNKNLRVDRLRLQLGFCLVFIMDHPLMVKKKERFSRFSEDYPQTGGRSTITGRGRFKD